MIVLKEVDQKIQIKLNGAVATNPVQFYASFMHLSGISNRQDNQFGTVNSATLVDVVSVPDKANAWKYINYINVKNEDTAAIVATLRFYDGVTFVEIGKLTLQAQERAIYSNGEWFVYDTTGVLITNTSGSTPSLEDVRAVDNQISGDIDANGNKITNLGAPVAANDATRKAYVDAIVLPETQISFTDNTTNNVSSTKHGYTPKSPADATKFLNGAATPAYANVLDSDLSTSDITTNNADATKHGFQKKLSGNTYDTQDGSGAWVQRQAADMKCSMGNGNTVVASTTSYFQPGFGSSSNNTETNRQSTITKNCRLAGLYVRTSTAQSGTGAMVITVRKTGAGTAITVTIAAGSGAGTFSDTSNIVSFAAGDRVSYEAANAASATSATLLEINCGVLDA